MWAASCCASCTCGLCVSVASGISRRSAGLAYCRLFALSHSSPLSSRNYIGKYLLFSTVGGVYIQLLTVQTPINDGEHPYQLQDIPAITCIPTRGIVTQAPFTWHCYRNHMIGGKQTSPPKSCGIGIKIPEDAASDHRKLLHVNGSLLPASVISVYCAYLCYSGLSSEPRDYERNGLHKHCRQASTGTLVVGMLTTVLSVVYSAV